MKGQIFISYSTKDTAVANQIVEYLEANGETCWIAPRNITSGRDYTDMINEAITDCRAFVVIISKKAVASQWVKKELTTATSFNKLVIPYKIMPVDLPGGYQFLLNNVQWIDATQNPTGNFHEILAGVGQEVLPPHPPQKKKPNPLLYVIIGLALAVLALAMHPWSKKASVAEDTVAAAITADTAKVEAVETPQQESATAKNDKRTPEPQAVKTEEPAASTQIVTGEKIIPEVTSEKPVMPEEPVVQPTETPVATVEPPKTSEQPKASEPPKTTKKTKTGPSASELAYKKKLVKAKTHYNNSEYSDAYKLLLELSQEKPSDKEVQGLIKECRNKLGK